MTEQIPVDKMRIKDSSTSPTDFVVPEMTRQDLETVRHQLEPLGWVVTYRMRVYYIPSGDLKQLLKNCPSFARQTESNQLRLLRIVEDCAEQRSLIERRLLQRFVGELTKWTSPIGELRRLDWPQTIEDFLSEERNSAFRIHYADLQLAEIATRHLRRLRLVENQDRHEETGALSSTCKSTCKNVDGNEQVFPLDPEVTPESFRAEIYNKTTTSVNGVWNNCFDCDLLGSSADDCGYQHNGPKLEVLSPSQLYRPYLNNWQPFVVSSSASAINDSSTTEDPLVLQRRRLLATVTGGLNWRQKQHRQQFLAVRLATRSALIGLKHSISVEPAKNYLELYVNMISRAVEATSQHVRRWSFNVERSWKEFKELAGAD